MGETFACQCGDTHEVYDGYRYCPIFYQKVNVIAEREYVEPRNVLSTGKWTQRVADELLGLN